MKAKLEPEQVTAVIDTREQTPLDLTPLRMTTGTLTTGDYSVLGLELVVAIERKSLSDLLCCVGRERDRFDREVMRLLAYPVRCLVVEATWPEIEQGEWRSQYLRMMAQGLQNAGDLPGALKYYLELSALAPATGGIDSAKAPLDSFSADWPFWPVCPCSPNPVPAWPRLPYSWPSGS